MATTPVLVGAVVSGREEETLTLDHIRRAKRLLDALPPAPPELRFVSSEHMLIGPFEDWSQVRSHGRAARRRRQGHPQRIRTYYKPDPKLLKLPDGTVVGHPATIAQLRNAISSQGGRCVPNPD